LKQLELLTTSARHVFSDDDYVIVDLMALTATGTPSNPTK
jgi:hypothetical protein